MNDLTDYEKDIVLLFVTLHELHPGKAQIIYSEHKDVIDHAFEWHEKTREDWKRELFIKSWLHEQ